MMTRMSFSYPEEYKEALQGLADADDRSMSAYVKKIFKKHLEENGIELQPIQTARVGRPTLEESAAKADTKPAAKTKRRRKRTKK